MKFKLGNKDIPFVFRGDELMYPNYVKDGLVLHYDFSGMTNEDTSRGIAKDLSGNGNHGTLQNFNYTHESGYDKNKLLFDGVDDYLTTDYRDNPEEITIELSHSNLSDFPLSTLLEKDNYSTERSYSIRKSVTSYRILFWEKDVDRFRDVSIPLSGKKISTITVRYSKESLDIFLNGSLVRHLDTEGIAVNPSTTNSNFVGNQLITSAKIYNRPLTPEEIAHNYAIEKERFGIE